jgi:hypothetical protein
MLRGTLRTALFAAAAASWAGASAQSVLVSRNPALFDQDARNFQTRLLAAHNRYRAEVGVPPLQWDERLAAGARAYGLRLAPTERWAHSPRAERPGIAESLWMGPRGQYSLEAMVDYWAEERKHYRPGLFPGVSTTGNWNDVSHYTQLIWRGTTHVGCALERSARSDFLICRYSPKGNRDGVRMP